MRSMVEGARRVEAPKARFAERIETGAAGIAPPPPRYTRSPSPYGGGSEEDLDQGDGWLAASLTPWARRLSQGLSASRTTPTAMPTRPMPRKVET